MSAIGYRPKGDSGPLYNPERDYAYITPTLMRMAIEALEANDNADRVQWREDRQITTEEINAAVTALASAQRDFVNAAEPVASFEQALARHEFDKVRYAVRQYIFAVIGEVMCGAWFTAVREVSIVGAESPTQTDMARFCAAVRAFVNKNTGTTYDANAVVDTMRMQIDVERTQVKMLLSDLKLRLQELGECRNELNKYKEASKPQSFVSRVLGFFRKKQ